MTPVDFIAWLDHVRAVHGWTKAEAMRQLDADKNQSARWARPDAVIPGYIGLACAALARQRPIAPWSASSPAPTAGEPPVPWSPRPAQAYRSVQEREKLAARPKAGPKMRSHVEGVQSAIWAAIRDRHPREWLSTEIADAIDAPIRTVQHYARALERAGIVEVVMPARATQAGCEPASYRTLRAPGPLTPIVRGAGGERIAYDPNGTATVPLHRRR